MYNVIEAIYENGKFIESVMLSTNDKAAAVEYENELRKKYKDRTTIDCFIKTDEEMEKTEKAKKRYDELTEEQKNDIIEVDGKKYIRALYEAN